MEGFHGGGPRRESWSEYPYRKLTLEEVTEGIGAGVEQGFVGVQEIR